MRVTALDREATCAQTDAVRVILATAAPQRAVLTEPPAIRSRTFRCDAHVVRGTQKLPHLQGSCHAVCCALMLWLQEVPDRVLRAHALASRSS